MRNKLCNNYCHYYKPDKDEELACLGFFIAERLMKKGLKLSFEKNALRPDPVTKDTLIKNMCINCPFYPGRKNTYFKKHPACSATV